MAIVGWLWHKQGERDVGLLEAILERLGKSRAPYAYFQPGGSALERLRSDLALERAKAEKAENQAADRKFLGDAR